MEKNARKSKTKQVLAKAGFSLVELLIGVVVLGILSSMVVAAGVSSQNKARASVATNDVDAFKNAVFQALITHPEVMKYTDTSAEHTTDLIKRTIDYINEELDESFRVTYIDTTAGKSGAVGYTTMQRDPWKNPYGLYIYTDSNTSTYLNAEGTSLEDNDSCLYIVLASAGPNGSGCAAGIDGNNINPENGTVIKSEAMVNNTDGIDDIGVIIRVKNGSTYFATFGADASTLGKLKGTQWIFGKPNDAKCGIAYDYKAKASKLVTIAGSLDRYPDVTTLNADASVSTSGIVGAWS